MSDSGEVQPLSWEVIAKMTQEEYEARRDEVRTWLASHPWRRSPSIPEMIARLAEKYSWVRPETTKGTPVKPRPRWHILWDRHSEK